ncbi:hypothetical protein CAEBREN_10589 [Caenorhabditis brenneri]|uniref:RING-type domain-containing protein n=1 Tax=Caenorhabditis brenneri TaxID=135651 RepID=G0P1L1_CAEBE|nr:hypothetical protein CAEBREN_10589 [Caenorhabditis brenneri]
MNGNVKESFKNSANKQESLKCNICCKLYSDTISSCINQILTECGHTLCHSCAETLQKRSPGQIDNPFDRKTTKVKVEKLHKNFAIINLIRENSDDEKPAMRAPDHGTSLRKKHGASQTLRAEPSNESLLSDVNSYRFIHFT